MEKSINEQITAYADLENFFKKRNDYIKKKVKLIKVNIGGDDKMDLLKQLLSNVLDEKFVNKLPTDLKWYEKTLKRQAKLTIDRLNNNLYFYKSLLEEQKSDMSNF